MEILLHPLVIWGLLIIGPCALFGFEAHAVPRPERDTP